MTMTRIRTYHHTPDPDRMRFKIDTYSGLVFAKGLGVMQGFGREFDHRPLSEWEPFVKLVPSAATATTKGWITFRIPCEWGLGGYPVAKRSVAAWKGSMDAIDTGGVYRTRICPEVTRLLRGVVRDFVLPVRAAVMEGRSGHTEARKACF